MPETPQHVGSRVDWAVNHLNSHWDLGLPRVHGSQARDLEKEKGSWAAKCFSRIRYLCFRVDIQIILSDFDKQARQLYSKWMFKPSQEKGTLPILPVTKSFLENDIQNKKQAHPIKLTTRQRADLLELLFNVLNEQFELARMSDSFSHERPSTSSFCTAPTTPQKSVTSRSHEQNVTPTRQIQQTHKTPKVEDEWEFKNPMTGSVKRSMGSPTSRNKRQQTLREFEHFRQAGSLEVAPSLQNDLVLPRETTSFDTVHTSGASSVFTTADDDDGDVFSSNDTSMEVFRWKLGGVVLRGSDQGCIGETFKRRAQLPPEVPFWLCWEVSRLADVLTEKPIDLYKKIQGACKSKKPPFEEFWAIGKELCRKDLQTPPPKSEVPNWMSDKNEYEERDSNKAAYLTANLEWNEILSEGLFKLRPNEIRLEKSCRLYRKFGADRFLVLLAPLFSKQSYPAKVRKLHNDGHILRQRITDFLARERHFIAGRYWRVFYVEPEKTKNRKKDQAPRQKFFLFAESGYDISPSRPVDVNSLNVSGRHRKMAIDDVAQWHMPFAANQDSTDLKLFSRWGIGLSRTTATTVLRSHEFVRRSNPRDGPVMDDGCALMSLPLAKAIWQACGGSEKSLPSAVQGRIAGAKGLWIVDYEWQGRHADISDRGYWIEVSDTQLKIKPHPCDRTDADECLRTFEVLKFAGKCKPGHLNMQLITILEDRGVPRTVLAQALRTDTRAYSDSVRTAIEDPIALLLWMGENGLYNPFDTLRVLGSFPVERRQQLRRLLESGFEPANCARMIRCMKNFLRDYMMDYTERLWITLPHSTSVFCIPDPLGVLQADEVCFIVSESMTNPRTGLDEFMLENTDVLVARVPAYLSSDIQRRKAVYKHELRHYRDVVIFPTQGSQPLASMLSGGDYDGDTCWVCWDPELVTSFRNAEVPPLPGPEDCGMSQHSRPLSKIFTSNISLRESLDNFLVASVDFNTRPSLLGSCSMEHERLIYSLSEKNKTEKLSDPKAVKLAALAGHLVDCNKQGWDLDEDAWYTVRRYTSGARQLPEPAYKTGTPPTLIAGTYPNVIDELKFGVAEAEKERVLADFEARTKDAGAYDEELSRYWNNVEKKAPPSRLLDNGQQQRGNNTILKLRQILDGLMHDINSLREFVREVRLDQGDSSPEGSRDLRSYNAGLQKVFERFQAIVPRDVDHDLRRRYEDEKDLPFPHWSLLRASCLHRYVCSNGGFPGWVWYVAGRELCHLKVYYHPGQTTHIAQKIYDYLKVNTKLIKGFLERKATEIDEVEEDDIVGS